MRKQGEKTRMARLVYYMNEKEVFKTAFEKKMSVNEARIVFDKLARHFKLGRVELDWTSGSRCPKAYKSIWGHRIKLNSSYNTFGVLCHELAHIQEFIKYKKSRHNKKHFRIMKRMIVYCERKNYFEAELKRRLAKTQRSVIRLQKGCSSSIPQIQK